MRQQPLKVANATTGIPKFKVVMSDDITASAPKNSLMTKNNTIEALVC
tara:strand:+ start:422 stop:565 length:144 start_codon:yes stop_codon:yes gene_type:complete